MQTSGKAACDTEAAEFILARLRLAQTLLEESDLLEGRDGFNFESETWWRHPRHEREALVVYLLLTCFDRVGQSGCFTTFADWLKSKKQHHAGERDQALASISPDDSHLDAARALADHYQVIYGVRNAFYRGINLLSEEARQQLLSTVEILFCPEYGMHPPNVSTPAGPLEGKESELRLKLKYLYERRNRFTHRLEQHHRSSIPLMAENRHAPSWQVWIRDEQLIYLCQHQEYEPLRTGGAYLYMVNDWPFALFEILYSVIKVPFDRTSIKIRFHVEFENSARPGVIGTIDGLEHCYLKDFRSLAENFWAKH